MRRVKTRSADSYRHIIAISSALLAETPTNQAALFDRRGLQHTWAGCDGWTRGAANSVWSITWHVGQHQTELGRRGGNL